MSNSLQELRRQSTIVADTGDVASIARLRPVDATTNPSLILNAVGQADSQVQSWIADARGRHTCARKRRWQLSAQFAVAISEHVERWVSLEADATLSYDTAGTIACADYLLGEVSRLGGDTNRILIKVAATWEGIRAAQVLESRGIKCNLTLIFALEQAQLCAAGGITLVSPFVGRITDWHKAQGLEVHSAEDDPGVQSVRRIYAWCKHQGAATLIMGASFRNCGQILGLAGCDLLTIAPALMDELAAADAAVPATIHNTDIDSTTLASDAPTESAFRLALANDAMAGEKLLEGIRRFAADQLALEARLGSEVA